MKKTDVKIGETYLVKVASNLVPVKITSELTSGGGNASGGGGGWEGTSVKTGKTIRIKSVQRLRKRLAGTKPKTSKTASKQTIAKSATRAKGTTKATKEATSATKRNTGKRGATGGQPDRSGGKRTSLLDVAAHILSLGTGQAMRCKDIVKIAIDRKLWAPKTGKTPANTLHAAITREINTKGASGGSRFRKAERGKFELAK